MDELWALGEELAKGCSSFIGRAVPNPTESCVDCAKLGGCEEERPRMPTHTFQLLKEAFRHDLIDKEMTEHP